MIKELQLVLSPREASNKDLIAEVISADHNIPEKSIDHIKLLKKSIDARKRPVKVHLKVEVYINEPIPDLQVQPIKYPDVTDKPAVVIIGCGPAGMFAALELIQCGFRPIVLERGKDVQTRRRDLAAINKEHIVNPDSNYCFGEGGAGTYSDGKLYTRSSKRGSIEKILNILVAHGAPTNILYEAHPHIGTNKLPKVVAAMRSSIINSGGEILFNSRVIDLSISNGEIKGVEIQGGERIECDKVILATGHSARDIYELLYSKKILIESKPFAMGVRVEHSQNLIDSIQYHSKERGPYLPAASYSLVQQVKDRGVFSFCMCPGGFMVPSATAEGEVVVNGMSPSKRDSRYANSGIVVGIETKDLQRHEKHGPLAGMFFQKEIEQMAFAAGGHKQTAPAQRLVDFCTGKISHDLPESSYQPGLQSAPLHGLLDKHIAERLQMGFKAFGKKMKKYYTNEAVIVGVETRTSSPVRIPRDKTTLQHPQIKGLYPCGEGAGYAGGIVSAAMDGERCAQALAQNE